MNRNQAPLRLVKNVIYPSYQLYATIANRRTPPETAFRLAILIAIKWIRRKFSELEFPKELDMPMPENYEDFSLDMLTSIRLDHGYVLDVVYIPELMSWSLQLVEPDLGLGSHPAVPGRIFTTNIGFRLTEGVVECGFNTIVSDHAHITHKSSVYRLGLVKDIVRHPMLGLDQHRTLIEHADILDTPAKMRYLRDFIDDDGRLMPVALFTMAAKEAEKNEQFPAAVSFTPDRKYYTICHRFLSGGGDEGIKKLQFSKNDEDVWEAAPESVPENPVLPEPPQAEEAHAAAEPFLPYDIAQNAHDAMGYGHYFIVAHDRLDDLKKLVCAEDISGGDVFLIEPKKMGGTVTAYPYSVYRDRADELQQEVYNFIQRYPLNKPMKYGRVLFSPAARLHQQEQIIRSTNSIAALVTENEKHISLLLQEYEEKLRLEKDKNRLHKEKTARLEEIIEKKDEQIAAMRQSIKDTEAECEKRIRGTEMKLQYLLSLDERPATPQEVPEWVEKKFRGRMIFHERACDLICDVPVQDIDMRLLCDALEYLATEYYDFYTGKISEDEAKNRSSDKYDRPFVVAPTGTGSINMTPTAYKVKYRMESRFSKEQPLDMHLKIGNTAPHLIRIYFFFDNDKDLIVVGSLPKHLSTTSNKT